MVTFVSKIYDEKNRITSHHMGNIWTLLRHPRKSGVHCLARYQEDEMFWWKGAGHLGTLGIRRGVFVLIIDSRFRGNDGMELIFHG